MDYKFKKDDIVRVKDTELEGVVTLVDTTDDRQPVRVKYTKGTSANTDHFAANLDIVSEGLRQE